MVISIDLTQCSLVLLMGDLEPNTCISLCRALTELLKQPGEVGGVDGTGGHHPIGTNGISGRSLRSNNGKPVSLGAQGLLQEMSLSIIKHIGY